MSWVHENQAAYAAIERAGVRQYMGGDIDTMIEMLQDKPDLWEKVVATIPVSYILNAEADYLASLVDSFDLGFGG